MHIYNRHENIIKEKKGSIHAYTTRTSVLNELKHIFKTNKTKNNSLKHLYMFHFSIELPYTNFMCYLCHNNNIFLSVHLI